VIPSEAAYIVEDYVVIRFMKPPITYLMAEPCGTSNGPFPAYFSPLECNTQNKIKEKVQKGANKNLQGAELFWEAYNTAKQDEHAFDRIVTFHQEYIFNRNMSFASFLAALALIVQLVRRVTLPKTCKFPKWLQHPRSLLAAFLFIGVILFERYLYFYRAHTIEILTSYAYGVESKNGVSH
jgi:hypothetical protein